MSSDATKKRNQHLDKMINHLHRDADKAAKKNEKLVQFINNQVKELFEKEDIIDFPIVNADNLKQAIQKLSDDNDDEKKDFNERFEKATKYRLHNANNKMKNLMGAYAEKCTDDHRAKEMFAAILTFTRLWCVFVREVVAFLIKEFGADELDAEDLD